MGSLDRRQGVEETSRQHQHADRAQQTELSLHNRIQDSSREVYRRPSMSHGTSQTVSAMGNAACFLCSDEASMITGVAMEVDGGRCI